MTTVLSGSDLGVKKAVGRVIQGWMRFSRLIRDCVEILGSGSKRDKQKERQAKGKEAINKEVKGKIEVLREREVTIDSIDSKPHQEVGEKEMWGSSRARDLKA